MASGPRGSVRRYVFRIPYAMYRRRRAVDHLHCKRLIPYSLPSFFPPLSGPTTPRNRKSPPQTPPPFLPTTAAPRHATATAPRGRGPPIPDVARLRKVAENTPHGLPHDIKYVGGGAVEGRATTAFRVRLRDR